MDAQTPIPERPRYEPSRARLRAALWVTSTTLRGTNFADSMKPITPELARDLADMIDSVLYANQPTSPDFEQYFTQHKDLFK